MRYPVLICFISIARSSKKGVVAERLRQGICLNFFVYILHQYRKTPLSGTLDNGNSRSGTICYFSHVLSVKVLRLTGNSLIPCLLKVLFNGSTLAYQIPIFTIIQPTTMKKWNFQCRISEVWPLFVLINVHLCNQLSVLRLLFKRLWCVCTANVPASRCISSGMKKW